MMGRVVYRTRCYLARPDTCLRLFWLALGIALLVLFGTR